MEDREREEMTAGGRGAPWEGAGPTPFFFFKFFSLLFPLLFSGMEGRSRWKRRGRNAGLSSPPRGPGPSQIKAKSSRLYLGWPRLVRVVPPFAWALFNVQLCANGSPASFHLTRTGGARRGGNSIYILRRRKEGLRAVKPLAREPGQDCEPRSVCLGNPSSSHCAALAGPFGNCPLTPFLCPHHHLGSQMPLVPGQRMHFTEIRNSDAPYKPAFLYRFCMRGFLRPSIFHT